MASGSDPSAVGDATVAASSDLPRAPAPPPPSSSSSKRRWSPCTWRYAIEEAQPELGSRPRSSSSNPFYAGVAASGSRGALEQTALASAAMKARLHHPEQSYGREAEEPRRSVYSSRSDRGRDPELSEALRGKHSRAEERLNSKRRQQQQPPKGPVKERSPEEEEEEQEGKEAEEGLESHGEEDIKRRKKEMSPSEFYFCEICASKAAAAAAAEAAKSNIKGSPSPLQDS